MTRDDIWKQNNLLPDLSLVRQFHPSSRYYFQFRSLLFISALLFNLFFLLSFSLLRFFLTALVGRSGRRLYLHLSHSATQVRSSLLSASLSLEPTSEREGEWISRRKRGRAKGAKGEEAATRNVEEIAGMMRARVREEEEMERERERARDPVCTCVGLDPPKLVSRAFRDGIRFIANPVCASRVCTTS